MTLQAAEMAALAPLDTMADTMLDQVRGRTQNPDPTFSQTRTLGFPRISSIF